jgi:hypothetical protein
MFWIRLYAVEIRSTLYLVYGYAVSAEEQLSRWADSTLYEGGSTWRLRRFNCFLSPRDLTEIGSQAESGSISLSTRTASVAIECNPLRKRPTVYATARSLISSGSPQSFSEDIAELDSYWCLSKKELIDQIFPERILGLEETRKAIRELFSHLQSDTGISFLADEVGRFGNFEIVRYLSGDVRRSDGLCCLISRSDRSLVVWVEPPLAGMPNLSVNCCMFNGGGPKGRTRVLDELRDCRPGLIVRFCPAEAFTQYEVSVWCEGRLVAHLHHSVMRSIGANLTIGGPTRRQVTRWSSSFNARLRERAERVRLDSRQQLIVRSSADDPWRNAELEAQTLAQSWFPSSNEGRFFPNAQESTLAAIEFLSDLMRRPGVIRVLIADPFFDRIGVESLLTRLGDVKEVRVVASHFTDGHSTLEDKTRELVAACDLVRHVLPRNLELSNLESPGGSTQQFHDRYIRIEFGDGKRISKREVWMLSNSLSSLAVRYPLLVTPLIGDVANDVASYLNSLWNAKLAGRTDLQSRVVWSNQPQSVASGRTDALSSYRSGEFAGWELILQVLVPEALSNSARAETAVLRGLLREHSPTIDWHVPSEALPRVVAVFKQALSLASRSALLRAIAQWAYHGGPSATEYDFHSGETVWLREELEQHLKDQQPIVQFVPLHDALALPESLEHLWYLSIQAPLDIHNGVTPELFFFAEALWSSEANELLQVLDNSRNFALLSWLCAYGRPSPSDDTRPFLLLKCRLGALQAAGLLFLRDRAEVAATEGQCLATLASWLHRSNLSAPDLLLSMIFLSARYTKPGISQPKPFADCASFWTGQPLTAEERNRIVCLIDRAAPNRAIPMVGALADECPSKDDANAFHAWCVAQIKAQLPLKPACPQQQPVRVVVDDITLAQTAKSAWHLTGPETPVWFCDAILGALDLWAAKEPLLRTREYQRWKKAVEDVLVGMSLGIAIVEAAPSTESREEFLRAAVPAMAKVLLKMGLEIWQHFVDFNARLAKLTVFLGCYADIHGEEVKRLLSTIATDDGVPSFWKLLLILQSASLTRNFSSQVQAMATAPSTPACHRDLRSIDMWAKRIVQSAENLAKTYEDLQGFLQGAIQSVNHWRENFLTTASDASDKVSD